MPERLTILVLFTRFDDSRPSIELAASPPVTTESSLGLLGKSYTPLHHGHDSPSFAVGPVGETYSTSAIRFNFQKDLTPLLITEGYI